MKRYRNLVVRCEIEFKIRVYILHDSDENIIYSNVCLVVVIFLSLFRAAVVSSPESLLPSFT